MPSPEALLIRIINHLAQHLKDRLVLKGGMLLRLYHSPRSTQDIDFVLVSTESKKQLRTELVSALRSLPDVAITDVRVNSRGIFLDVKDAQHLALIEVSVLPSLHLPAEPLSTAALSAHYSLAGHIVSTMAMAEAFAHKIAATLERDVARDLYDLSQMEAIGTPFDRATLAHRLSHVAIDRAKPVSISPAEASRVLRQRLDALDQPRIEAELYPLLPRTHHTGLLPILRASVGRIIQQLDTLS